MEFDVIKINAGFRYDQFDPQRTIPTDYQKPEQMKSLTLINLSLFMQRKKQISPRLYCYQLGARGCDAFELWHFFQMPPLYSYFFKTMTLYLLMTLELFLETQT